MKRTSSPGSAATSLRSSCPTPGGEGAFAVGERVRDRIAAHRFLARDGLDIHLTASVGVATLPDVAASAEELVAAADKAMYRVKDSGKNGIQAARLQPITDACSSPPSPACRRMCTERHEPLSANRSRQEFS